MKAETVQAYQEVRKRLTKTQRGRILTYGPDTARFLLLLFDAVDRELGGNSSVASSEGMILVPTN